MSQSLIFAPQTFLLQIYQRKCDRLSFTRMCTTEAWPCDLVAEFCFYVEYLLMVFQSSFTLCYNNNNKSNRSFAKCTFEILRVKIIFVNFYILCLIKSIYAHTHISQIP